MPTLVRRLRHWKQRFTPGAAFVFRHTTVFGGVRYNPGDSVPGQLAAQPLKLRRFWLSKRIELAEFREPDAATGQPPRFLPFVMVHVDMDESYEAPQGVVITKRGGGWYDVADPDGNESQLRGRDEVEAFTERLKRKHGRR